MEEEKKLTPTGEKLYGKSHLPKKICPYCGFRNDARADTCEECGKDISWIKVPELVPGVEEPELPSRPLPEQQKVFSTKQLIILVLILILLVAAILVLVFVGKGKGAELGVYVGKNSLLMTSPTAGQASCLSFIMPIETHTAVLSNPFSC